MYNFVFPTANFIAQSISKAVKIGYENAPKVLSAGLQGLEYVLENIAAPTTRTFATHVHTGVKEGHQWVKDNIDPIYQDPSASNSTKAGALAGSLALKVALGGVSLVAECTALGVESIVPAAKLSYFVAQSCYQIATNVAPVAKAFATKGFEYAHYAYEGTVHTAEDLATQPFHDVQNNDDLMIGKDSSEVSLNIG